MTEPTDFRTTETGNIDYAHYTRRGRELRSFAVLDALRKLRRSIRIAIRFAALRDTTRKPDATRPGRARI